MPIGATNYVQTGRIGVPDYNAQARAVQAEQLRKQNEAAQQAAQQKINDQNYQRQARDLEMRAAQTALDQQQQLIQNPANPRTTTGTQMQISNTGTAGGGSGTTARAGAGSAISGINVNGGLYKDITSMLQQMQNTPVAPPPRVAPPTVPSTPNALGPAKEASGRIGQKALEALRNQMTARGMSDSGMATEGEANILGNVARTQAEAMFDAANTDNSRQWEANKLGYAGDNNYNEMLYSGQLGQRNQNLNILMSLLKIL